MAIDDGIFQRRRSLFHCAFAVRTVEESTWRHDEDAAAAAAAVIKDLSSVFLLEAYSISRCAEFSLLDALRGRGRTFDDASHRRNDSLLHQ